jgi:hypothetical protein
MAEAEVKEAVDVKEVSKSKEKIDARREFTLELPGGEINHYFIANPSGEDIRKADWQYSKVYNQAIMDGFMTQAQMVEVLKKKGIINDDYTDRLERVRTSLAAELFRLENLLDEASDEEKEATALEVASLRDELFQLNQMVNGPMGNTCENLAEDARTEFLTSRVIQTKDGKRVWETFEDYYKEENTALCVKSRFEVMLWMQGLGSDFLENTPEQKMLRDVAQLRLEKAMEEIKAEADEAKDRLEKEADSAVTEEVEEISLDNVPEEKPKSRRGRPKSSAKKTTSKKKAPKRNKKPVESE